MVNGGGVRLDGVVVVLGLSLVVLGCGSTRPVDGDVEPTGNCGFFSSAVKISVSECEDGAYCNVACDGGGEQLSLESSLSVGPSSVKTRCNKNAGACTNSRSKICWKFDLDEKVTKAVVTHVSAKGEDQLYREEYMRTFGGAGDDGFNIKTNPSKGIGRWGYEIKLYNEVDGEEQLYACVDPRIEVDPP